MFFVLQSLFIILIEMICCRMFFDLFCEWNDRRKKFASLLLVLLCISIFGVSYALENYMLIKEVPIAFLIAIFMKILYDDCSLVKSLILSVIFLSLVFVTEYLSALIFSGFRAKAAGQSAFLDSMLVIFSKLSLFVFIIFISRLIDRKSIKYFKSLQWLRFSFFPVFSIVMIVIIITKTGDIIDNGFENVFKVLAFGLMVMNVVVFYSIKDMALTARQVHETDMIRIQADNQLKLYKRIMADTEYQRRMSHEYQNQLECIQTLCEAEKYEELKKYLENLNGVMRRELDRINTNHAIVNAVLNTRYKEAVDKGILFVCSVNDMSGLQMEQQDIVVLLSNLLKNAIEACQKCKENKYIKLKLILEHDTLILSIRNSCNGVMKDDKGRLITTKTDRWNEHGIGLKNINHVIEKYGGYYSIEPEEKEFFISIIIPQEKGLSER